MYDREKTFLRSRLFSGIIGRREDETQRRIIEAYADCLCFDPIEKLMISAEAWAHVETLEVAPKFVFAHPEVLREHPTTSLYYRGMTLLSQKQVQQMAGTSVASWEGKQQRKSPVRSPSALKVAQLYNAMISCIIEGSTDWTLENGYRNIVATMGITLDGMYRNKIGQMAEELVKSRILEWLKTNGFTPQEDPENKVYSLPQDAVMKYGSEPDIEFLRNGCQIATIEIKGGTDPAGALERLGAMTKSFAETPPGCVNFLVAGVVTEAMKSRLDEMGDIKVYLLHELSNDGEAWDDFINEVFFHAVRIFPRIDLAKRNTT